MACGGAGREGGGGAGTGRVSGQGGEGERGGVCSFVHTV